MWYKRWIALIIGFGVFCSMGGLAGFAMDAAGGTVLPGLDVSEYQGDIDFEQVAAAGYQAVCIRAGLGDDTKDPFYAENYEKAAAAGLKIGFYYYVTAQDTRQASAQAEAFARILDGKKYSMRPAMDFEVFDGLTDSEIREIGLAFLETLESETGIIPMLYSDAYDAQTVWDGRFGAYPLWVADYEGGVPPDNAVWETWTAFQYADDGAVPGIETACDLDYFTAGAFYRSDDSPATGDAQSEETVRFTGYIAKPGDTPETIAAQCGMDARRIAEYNEMAVDTALAPRQLLLIPHERIYIVRQDDTLKTIGYRFHIDIYALAEYNHLSRGTELYAGRRLLIPNR